MESKDNKKKIIAVLLVIIIGLVGAVAYLLLSNNEEPQTAILVETDKQLQDTDGTNKIKVNMNSSVTVKEGTMQDLNFYNLNEGRDLQLKIKVGEKYIYESQLLETGKGIKADVVDTSPLKKGENTVIGEIYSFDSNGELRGHHNVKFVMYY